MPIIHGIRKISPLDLNKNVKIGVAYPINENNLFNGTETIKEQIKTNIIDLLLTEQGERINMPTYGVGLKNMLFEQNLEPQVVKDQVENQINRFISTVKLHDVQTANSSDGHTLYIRIAYSFIGTTSNSESPEILELQFED